MVIQLDFATSPFLVEMIRSQIVLAIIIRNERQKIIKGITIARMQNPEKSCDSEREGFLELK